jgi:hypothetical protein
MEADDSIELGPSAPALELPWQDPEGRSQYVELRGENLDRLTDCIPEAKQFPFLRRFLVSVNSPQSKWKTAKCDVWADQAEAIENPYNAAFTHSSYVDVVLAEEASSLRADLEVHRRVAKELVRMLEANGSLEAVAEIVVRRCYFHHGANLEESDAGYCLTLFLISYGASPTAAAECWGSTLEFAAKCLLKLQPRKDGAQKTELG